MWDPGESDPAASTMDGPKGTKIAVPAADGADMFVVTTASGHFAVPAVGGVRGAGPGAGPDPPAVHRASSTATGEELAGDHFGTAWHAIAVAAAAESVGVAAAVTRMSVEYAKERKQFGRPIGSYQAVSHACAQMFLETEGARNVVLWAAWALEHDPENAFMAANCAKAYASDAAVNVCRSAMQVHGGIGFTWEHDLHLYFKRAEANARAFGDSGWHREQVAAAYL